MRATSEGLAAFQREAGEKLTKWNSSGDRKKDHAFDGISNLLVSEALKAASSEAVEDNFDAVCSRLGFMTDFARWQIYRDAFRKLRATLAEEPTSVEENSQL